MNPYSDLSFLSVQSKFLENRVFVSSGNRRIVEGSFLVYDTHLKTPERLADL